MSEVLDLACELIRRRSLTPDDAGCQQLIADRLDTLGFVIEDLPYGNVSNLWARRGNVDPLFCFAGHTDVVPAGPRESWDSDPFEPTIRDNILFGRGSADMKGSLAAMLVATEAFVLSRPDHAGSIAFLITSDEEGIAVDGTQRVIQTLQERGTKISHCLVGEPGSDQRLGDTVRIGRRGSLHGELLLKGKQGHVAYPTLADNPIHRFGPALTALCAETWDEGNEHFPQTTLQISNMQSGTGADNVIPGELHARFNFRFSTSVSVEQLQQRAHTILNNFSLNYQLDWRVGGMPFLSKPGKLVAAVQTTLEQHCGVVPVLSTAGGTSDGRFIAPTGAEIVELGPINASIHQANEHVSVADLEKLVGIYRGVLEEML